MAAKRKRVLPDKKSQEAREPLMCVNSKLNSWEMMALMAEAIIRPSEFTKVDKDRLEEMLDRLVDDPDGNGKTLQDHCTAAEARIKWSEGRGPGPGQAAG